ncbi:hypothetical protein [Acinetobacter sp.]|uniref:hypothetical protein n=1 Tax=Acinetobacter sp. TaxID=472 RepID=UPI00375305A9
MEIQKEKIKQEFWNWAKVENPRVVEDAELGDVYAIQTLDHMFMGFAAAKTQAVPEGFVLVPKEPTPKMIDATWDYDGEIQEMSHNTRNEFIYKAMIEAREPVND